MKWVTARKKIRAQSNAIKSYRWCDDLEHLSLLRNDNWHFTAWASFFVRLIFDSIELSGAFFFSSSKGNESKTGTALTLPKKLYIQAKMCKLSAEFHRPTQFSEMCLFSGNFSFSFYFIFSLGFGSFLQWLSIRFIETDESVGVALRQTTRMWSIFLTCSINASAINQGE